MSNAEHAPSSSDGGGGKVLPPGPTIRNSGEPILLSNVTLLMGVTAEGSLPGAEARVWHRFAATSDDAAFHVIADNLAGVIQHEANQNGLACPPLDGVKTLLYVVRADQTAELWIDTAAVTMTCVMKRSVQALSPVFATDLADILEMRFPNVVIGETDRVLCLFREGWRFALAFDFNVDGKLDIQSFSRTLGVLYRRLRFSHVYGAVETPELFSALCDAGWFPFAEVVAGDFEALLGHLRSNLPLDEPEAALLAKFDEARINHLFERWMAKPHLSKRSSILRSGLDAFLRGDAVAAIKVLITEIEGFLSDAHRDAKGQPARGKALIEFAVASAVERAGHDQTLMLPRAFADYLARYTFASFDPTSADGTAGSRHAVGHGAAAADTYTMLRALQLILTVDQLAFYT